METNNMAHIGVDALITNMMIHSLSPQGRRLVERMYTGDPFKIDVKLDSDSKNRSAEIANTYLKTVGRRIKFIKRRKNITKITMSPIRFNHDPYTYPVRFLPEELREGFDYVKDFEERQKENTLRKEKGVSPISFEGIDRRRKERLKRKEEEE
jgi:hypothetical protein